jgi:hypothetical protein
MWPWLAGVLPDWRNGHQPLDLRPRQRVGSDQLHGDRRGDELPQELSTSAGRRGWPREAKKRWRPSARRTRSRDPDSKVVKGLRGWIQGYNAQAVTNEHQIVLAAEIANASR